jgi:hypothetical protein
VPKFLPSRGSTTRMPSRLVRALAALASLAALAALAVSGAGADPRPAPRTVRVVLTVRGGAIAPTAALPALRAQPTRSELARLRSRRVTRAQRAAIAERVQRRRIRALRGLSNQAARANRPLVAVYRHVERLSGQLEQINRLTGTLTVRVPRATVGSLRGDARVASLAYAGPRPRPMAAQAADTVGAPTWWAAGFLGGRGTSDAVPTLAGHGQAPYCKANDQPGCASLPDLGISDVESIQEDHPMFSGVTFVDPPGASTSCSTGGSSCGGHATEVLSAATGEGPSSCPVATGYTCTPSNIDPNIKGSAPRIDRVLDLYGASASGPGDAFDGNVWGEGITQSGLNHGTLTGTADPMEVFNGSYGSIALGSSGTGNTALEDYGPSDSDADAMATLGILPVFSAGNDGPTGGWVASPSIAYDTLSVGGFDPGAALTDASDDTVFDWSSRGPSPLGRKKPDLVADGRVLSARWDWRTSGQLWRTVTGTSFSAPQTAGAALLLEASGITDPLAVKAILIDSARPGRATPTDPMGTQSGWQADWGWGELNLDAAYQQRNNFYVGTVSQDAARFYSATTQATGDKATITWNRRVAANNSDLRNRTKTVFALSNLNLAEYDNSAATACASSPTPRASSTSTIDNVEQVRSPSGSSVVYKVSAGTIDGASAEPYAIAGANQVTPLAPPTPAVTVSSDTTNLGPNDVATVTVTASNPSADLVGCAPTIDLQPTSGAQVVGVLDPQPSSDLATNGSAGDTVTRRFRVQGTSSGVAHLVAAVNDRAYGSILTGTGQQNVNVDVTGPSTSISAPSGTLSPGAFTVSWSATDTAGVTGYATQVSVDGGPWNAWTSGSSTSASYDGEGGHRYRFRVQATDGYGNTSAWVESGDVTVASPAPPPGPITGPVGPVTPTQPPTPTTPTTPQRSPALKITAAKYDSKTRRVTLTGTLASHATGRVKVTLTVKQGKKTKRLTSTVTASKGRFTARFKLSSRSQRATRVTAAYAGDKTYRQATATRSVTRSTSH